MKYIDKIIADGIKSNFCNVKDAFASIGAALNSAIVQKREYLYGPLLKHVVILCGNSIPLFKYQIHRFKRKFDSMTGDSNVQIRQAPKELKKYIGNEENMQVLISPLTIACLSQNWKVLRIFQKEKLIFDLSQVCLSYFWKFHLDLAF